MLILPDDVKRERLISDDYRKQQQQMHEQYEYGTASKYYAPLVARVINQYGVERLLDYGAGRGNLMKTLAEQQLLKRALKVQHYEPAREEWADTPDPTEMVACIDVLEHIEPELIENVLDDLQRVTLKVGAFSVATTPAHKTLPDGRNAHLIQEDETWWLPKFWSRFDLVLYQRTPDGFFILVQAKEKAIK